MTIKRAYDRFALTYPEKLVNFQSWFFSGYQFMVSELLFGVGYTFNSGNLFEDWIEINKSVLEINFTWLVGIARPHDGVNPMPFPNIIARWIAS